LLLLIAFTTLDLFEELRDKVVAPILTEENHTDRVRTAYDTRALL
jgi:hypothetical protein